MTRKSLFSKSGAASTAVTVSFGSRLITLISGMPLAVRSNSGIWYALSW